MLYNLMLKNYQGQYSLSNSQLNKQLSNELLDLWGEEHINEDFQKIFFIFINEQAQEMVN
jgi:hypothetical protein